MHLKNSESGKHVKTEKRENKMMVRQLQNKNQFEITMKGEKIFQSYESVIAKIDKNGVLTFGKNWDYSITILKHLYIFIKENSYKLNDDLYNLFYIDNNFNYLDNKRKFLQNLIDTKIIKIKEIK